MSEHDISRLKIPVTPEIKKLMSLAEYYPSGCMCGWNESCSICSRSEEDREHEESVRKLAVQLLETHHGITAVNYFDNFSYRVVYFDNSDIDGIDSLKEALRVKEAAALTRSKELQRISLELEIKKSIEFLQSCGYVVTKN